MIKSILSRNITDFTKVQQLISKIIRGQSVFINRKKLQNKKYLDIGCGPNTSMEFVNLDYHWTPNIDVCWDLSLKKLPFEENQFEGIFSEHCLEHVSFEVTSTILKECFRILKPSGVLRIIVPDGEIYCDLYIRKKKGEQVMLPYEEAGYISPMHRINGIFRKYGHQFIYDFETLSILLKNVGFSQISKVSFGKGIQPKLFHRDTEWRAIESLYIEAVK